ncbi:MAG: hypothetical protein ABFS86_14245 [Planctomycetota bacterium]
MRSSIRLARILPVILLAVAAGGAALGQADDGPFVLIDFETGGVEMSVKGSQMLQTRDGDRGSYGRWVVEDAPEGAGLWILNMPPDLSAYRAVSFRIRRESESCGMVFLRVHTKPKGEIFHRVPGIGKEWRTIVFALDAMPIRGPYNPLQPKELAFWLVAPKAGEYHIDDVRFLKEYSPPEDLVERCAAETFTIADFETPGAIDWLDYKGCTLSTAPAGKKDKDGTCLRWSIDGSADPAGIYFFDIPLDIRQYRAIRFRIRAEKTIGKPFGVKLQSGFDNGLTIDVEGVGKKWKEIEVLLPVMRDQGFFLPRRLENFGIFLFRPKPAVVYLDDIRLVKGENGWRYSSDEMKVVLFGKRRARKAKRITTSHFDLYTDSKAAVSGFPEGLEKAYEFVKLELGLEEMAEPLPVYIFQNQGGLKGFLVDHCGMSGSEAAGLYGIANARHIAALYHAPESAFIVRQMTRALVHRSWGREGGSWFQDGVAKYIEFRWQKQSAAEQFASRIRSDSYVPLSELLAMGKLFRQGSAKGGSGSADALSRQAAAFYEFLARGPLKTKWSAARPVLATAPVKDSGRVNQVESLFGMSIPEIEEAWVEWGSRPPRDD